MNTVDQANMFFFSFFHLMDMRFSIFKLTLITKYIHWLGIHSQLLELIFRVTDLPN
jgi:hypothetical protein